MCVPLMSKIASVAEELLWDANFSHRMSMTEVTIFSG